MQCLGSKINWCGWSWLIAAMRYVITSLVFRVTLISSPILQYVVSRCALTMFFNPVHVFVLRPTSISLYSPALKCTIVSNSVTPAFDTVTLYAAFPARSNVAVRFELNFPVTAVTPSVTTIVFPSSSSTVDLQTNFAFVSPTRRTSTRAAPSDAP